MVMKPRQKILTQLIKWTFSTVCALGITNTCFATNNDGLNVYKNTPSLSEEHKQKIAEDLSRFQQADNIWDVLRDEFSLPHYENNPLVQEKIEWFMNNQDFLLRSVNRAAPYLYYIMEQVKKRHLPAELALLPIVESGYNPFATSNVGAAGIWQLMPGTATGLGIQQDRFYDGRRDVIASTHAALNYLAYLQSFFDGNWLLAIAAYNTGEGNVLAAIRRNINDGRDTDFWSLPVAQQTKNYVPSILALAVIISKPRQYPIYFPPIRNAPYLAKFDVQKKINLKQAAALAGISYDRLLQLNPGYSKPSTKGGYKIVLPIENVEQFSENLMYSPYHETTSLGFKHYRMKAGDTLASVAKKFKISVDEIRKLNHITKSVPKRGTNLLIPESEEKNIASKEDNDNEVTAPIERRLSKKLMEAESRPSSTYRLQPGDTIYMVRNTDNLDSISKRFHINPETIKSANRLKSKILVPGKNLVIPTHPTQDAAEPSQQEIAPAKPKPKSRELVYYVKRGDTIARIAKRFKTSPAALRLANLIDDKALIEGEKLTIPITS